MSVIFYQENTPILSVWPHTSVLSTSWKEDGWYSFRIILKGQKLLGVFQIANIFTMNLALIAKKRWGKMHTHIQRFYFYISKKITKFVISCYWGLFVFAGKFRISDLIGKSVRCQRPMGECHAIKEIENAVLTSQVFKCYLGGLIAHKHNKVFEGQFIGKTFKEREKSLGYTS